MLRTPFETTLDVVKSSRETSLMQTVQLVSHAIGTLALEQRPLPDELPPGALLARASMTAISAGTEIANYLGRTTFRSAMTTTPYYPGYCFTGVVVATGPGNNQFAVGDRISGPLPHAAYALEARPDVLTRLAHVPDTVTDRAAALTQLCCISLNAVRKATIELGDRVAIVGGGVVGLLATRFCVLSGARRVVVLEPIERRRAAAIACGAHLALDPAGAAANERLTEAAPAGFDAVIEATGDPGPVVTAMSLAAPGGRVVLLGSTRGLVEHFDPYGDIHLKGITVIGAHVTTHPATPTRKDRWSELANREFVLDLMASGSLDVESIVSHVITPEEAPATYATLARERAAHIGVLIDWSDGRFTDPARR